MANYLASIFGTEQDKVNCSFYYKIGACRHGDRCSRKHVKPSYSQTILLPNLYQNPAYDPKNKMNPSQLQNHFDAFYEDIWCEMCKYGELEELVVCDNNNDHLIGNVYARFKYEDSAQAACDALNSRCVLSVEFRRRGVAALDEEVVEDERTRRAECQPKSESGADAEEILDWRIYAEDTAIVILGLW
ncbi:hypothetical protein DTO212C5_5591 [Paecilomyces variotii]|nr:hypothetical protein DTO212C5_5591 [Paecilomyces variotii]